MKTLKIQGYQKEFYLKTSWSEMTPQEILQCSWVRSNHIEESDQLALNASRIILFSILTNIPRKVLDGIQSDQWVDILPELNFIFKAPDFKENPFPKIRYSRFRKPLYGPVGLLDRSRVEEFVNADNTFINANKKPVNTDHFYLLFAILWRPLRNDIKTFQESEEWDGDMREPFNMSRAKERSEIYKSKVPLHIVVFSFLFYWSFREQKLLHFKNIFQNSTGSEKRQGNNYGWAGPILELSGKSLGTMKELKNEYWHTFILELSRQMELAKKREEEIEKLKSKR